MDSCRAWQFSLYGGEAISLQTWLCRHGSWNRKELSRVFSSQRNFMESQGEMSMYFEVTTTSPVQVCRRVLNLLRLTLGERGCTSQGQRFTSTTNEHSGWTHAGSGRTAASLKVFDYGDIICMHASSLLSRLFLLQLFTSLRTLQSGFLTFIKSKEIPGRVYFNAQSHTEQAPYISVNTYRQLAWFAVFLMILFLGMQDFFWTL